MSHPVPPTLPASVPFQGPLHGTLPGTPPWDPTLWGSQGQGPRRGSQLRANKAAVGPYPEVRSADPGGEGLDCEGAAWIERLLSV